MVEVDTTISTHRCGPMGAGKGWVMNWMSQRDILPLRRVVHVDPDRFKCLMPEWPSYMSRDPKCAGRCVTGISTLAELAQALAAAVPRLGRR